MKRNIILLEFVLILCLVILLSVGVFAAEEIEEKQPSVVYDTQNADAADISNAEEKSEENDNPENLDENSAQKSLYSSENLPMMVAVIVIFSAGGVYTFTKINKNSDKNIK